MKQGGSQKHIDVDLTMNICRERSKEWHKAVQHAGTGDTPRAATHGMGA